MSKASFEFYLKQKWYQEQQQFRQQIIDEVNFNLMAFQDKLRQEMRQEVKQEVYQQQQNQRVEVKIDAAEAAKEIQRALRF